MLPLRPVRYNSPNLIVKFITISRASARATASVRPSPPLQHRQRGKHRRMIACGGLRAQLRDNLLQEAYLMLLRVLDLT